MSIFTNKNISNFANNQNTRKFVSKLCTPGTIAAVIVLEGAVTAGRTYQAQKRGGIIESRERLTEEVIAAGIWLWGIDLLNKGFDFLITKIGKIQQKTGLKDFNFDTGRDNIRKPFEYTTQNIKNPSTKKMIAALKFSKIVASAALAVGFMGFVLPKINQSITKSMLNKQSSDSKPTEPIKIPARKHQKRLDMNEFLVMSKGSAGDPSISASKQSKSLDINESLTMSRGSAGDPKFDGGTFFEIAAHKLENDTATKLLTLDGGLFTGRAVNARNQYERTEILFRDLVSSFFYIYSTLCIYKALCAIDTLKGKNTNLDPEAAHTLHEKMNAEFGTSNSMSKEDFKAKILGTRHPLVSDTVFDNAGKIFEGDIATVDKMHKFIDENINDKDAAKKLKDKASKLSELQPKHADKSILTKSQLTNLFHNGALNEAEFINGLINDLTDKKAMNPVKFVAQKKIDKHRQTIVEYAESILTKADKEGQKDITKDFLQKMKTRNVITKASYWGAGMAVSAFFLAYAIPKIQYWITKKTTGHNDFPGIQKYEKQK